jgi:hypothetical protein
MELDMTAAVNSTFRHFNQTNYDIQEQKTLILEREEMLLGTGQILPRLKE